jgi:hypothetical protein
MGNKSQPVVENMRNTTARPHARHRFGNVITRFRMVISYPGSVISCFGKPDQRSRSTETTDHPHSKQVITFIEIRTFNITTRHIAN